MSRLRSLAFSVFALHTCALSLVAAGASDTAIASRTASVDGVKLHYLTAGHGPTVILLHGYTQTSRMWKPIMPLLAEKFTVIAPDLPGIGESDIPPDGIAKLTMPMLSVGGEKSLGKELGEQAKLVADHATVIVLTNTGHWVLEENPKETTKALIDFL